MVICHHCIARVERALNIINHVMITVTSIDKENWQAGVKSPTSESLLTQIPKSQIESAIIGLELDRRGL